MPAAFFVRWRRRLKQPMICTGQLLYMIGPAAFSISAAAKMTGLSPDLLRAWERRHGLIEPLRAANGRRLYSRDDVEHLRLLKSACDAV